ncbi:probable long-chain-alcohol O-fatty-acyltransferase 5 [Durio zibethinus]|uniref:Probable long-chain-alcohol O-fatty-acyltransferase 5 n=1 Tax=Durio zibethinus TaxID=66656 RepID=A0A6P5WP45_DURZI|nr:probable long-chain-alcohol O-fatty-acyltransferase 5 [Durio zibethinus]
MEDELKNFIRLWLLTIPSISYSYYIAAKIPKGLPRLLSLFPIVTLLSVLPFNNYSFHLGAPLVFCLSWLTNFKLLSFAFDQGPLSPPPQKLHLFILTACSPFKVKQTSAKIKNGENPSQENDLKVPSMILEAAAKATLLVLLFHSYNYKKYFHKHVLLTLYFFHTYLTIQFLLAVAAIPAQLILLGVELEPQFNAPLLATSLQDFWGHRWNLRVSDALRPTIYNPLRSVSARIIGSRWASLPAVFATFVISGLMHELIYYHITRENPTWEVTWFFVLQGIFVDMEIVLKKKLVATETFRLHRTISGPLALANLAVTAGWLSYTQLLRNGIDEKLIKEFNVFLEFLKGSA